jgi:hypothetical protein
MKETVYDVLARINRREEGSQLRELPADVTSLDFLQAVYRDPTQPLHTRLRAAALALPFEHPKLAVVAQLRGEGFAAQLEAAMRRAGKSVVIDAKAVATIERKHLSPSK